MKGKDQTHVPVQSITTKPFKREQEMTVDHRQRPVVTHTGNVFFVFSGKGKEELETSDKSVGITL